MNVVNTNVNDMQKNYIYFQQIKNFNLFFTIFIKKVQYLELNFLH